MSEYIEQEIPILDEHDLVDEDGKVLFSFNSDLLQEVADNNNRRIKETGDETPIVIGHTKDGLRESEQPEIVGWGRSFSVKKLMKTGRKAIFCLARFMKDKVDKIKQFPRRSVELWLRKKLIDPISLLGATTPERDLGLLRFSNGEHKYSYSMESNMDNDMVSKVMAAIEQSDWVQWVKQKMAEDQAPEAEEAPVDAGLPSVGDQAPMDQAPIQPDQAPAEKDKPLKESAFPSGSNVAVPEFDKVRMQADQARTELIRFQAKLDQVEKENQELKLKFRRADRERDLVQLESEGYLFDRVEELEDTLSLDDGLFKKHLDKMKKRYSRAPIGPVMYKVVQDAPGNRGMTQDQASAIISYATSKGLSYEAAKSELNSQQKVF